MPQIPKPEQPDATGTPPVPEAKDPKVAPEGAATGQGGMTAQEIRDAGWAIDLPYEAPDAEPTPLRYSEATEGREEWTPPEGFTMGGVPWDELPAIEREAGDAADPRPTPSSDANPASTQTGAA